MDDKFAKQLKTIVGEVVEEKIEQQVGKIVDEKLEEKLAPIYAWQKKADEKFANLPKEIMLIFGEGFDAVASPRLHDLEEQTEDHEKRIKKLEKTNFVAP